MRRYAHIVEADIPPVDSTVVTRDGKYATVIEHLEEGQIRLQFAGSVQGIEFYADVTPTVTASTPTEGKWVTSGEEFHFAAQDYPELEEILDAPRPMVSQTSDTAPKRVSLWASKTAGPVTPVPDIYEGTGIKGNNAVDYYRCKDCGGQYTVPVPHVERPTHGCNTTASKTSSRTGNPFHPNGQVLTDGSTFWASTPDGWEDQHVGDSNTAHEELIDHVNGAS